MAERSGCGLSRPPGFTREGWSLRAARPLTISHHAVLGPARPPTAEELTELPGDCSITELQTPAATLGWAVPSRYLPRALEGLHDQPADVPAAGELQSNINTADE